MIPIVGFYTENTPYEEEAELMKQSALQNGVEKVYLFPVQARGTWEKNCAIKPEILLHACDKLKRPFLYVDADARIKQYMSLFDLDWNHYDIGAHYHDGKRGIELLAGTIFVNPTDETKFILNRWIISCHENPAKWDQVLLQMIISTDNPEVLRLPPEYTFIHDIFRRKYGPDMSPVIEHYQASRKYKRLMRQRKER